MAHVVVLEHKKAPVPVCRVPLMSSVEALEMELLLKGGLRRTEAGLRGAATVGRFPNPILLNSVCVFS